MTVFLREAMLSDAPSLAQLMMEHPLWQSYGLTLEGQAARFEQIIADATQFLYVATSSGAPGDGVAHADPETAAGPPVTSGSPVAEVVDGFIAFDTRTFARNGYIQLIGVRQGLTGRQIGDALMRAAHDEIRKTTAKCFLLCTSTNDGAQRFYRRHGYKQVGELRDWLKPGIHEFIFCNENI